MAGPTPVTEREEMADFELRDHTADVAVAASGATLGAAFAAAGDGLAAAQCDAVPPDGEQFDLRVTAESRESLLFDYLDELIYRRDVDGVLPVDNEAVVSAPASADAAADSVHHGDSWRLDGSARGVPLDAIAAREVKAVTYSEMRVAETASGWTVYVVLDV